MGVAVEAGTGVSVGPGRGMRGLLHAESTKPNKIPINNVLMIIETHFLCFRFFAVCAVLETWLRRSRANQIINHFVPCVHVPGKFFFRDSTPGRFKKPIDSCGELQCKSIQQ
jgi:hypothetical protein